MLDALKCVNDDATEHPLMRTPAKLDLRSLIVPWSSLLGDSSLLRLLLLIVVACPLAAFPSEPSAVKRLSPDQYQIGLVRLDAKAREIELPATLNMREGQLEYLLVHSYGKTHESLFKTEAQPYHIHLAALLLQQQGQDTELPVPPRTTGTTETKNQAGPVYTPATNVLHKGIQIEIKVLFDQPEAKPVRAESLILDLAKEKPMKDGPWSYNGSRLAEGVFLAQRDGSIVAVIADPDALADNPGPRRNDDDNWQALTATLPPLGTKATIRMRFLSPAKNGGEEKQQ